MTKFFRAIAKFVASLVLLWFGAMLFATAIRVAGPFLKRRDSLAGLVTFVAGLFLFHCYHCNILYIFGHEMTHWLVAKIFLRDTGKIRLGKNKGSVEVADTNIWITLAPYILPFYVIVACAVFGLVQLFCANLPWWAGLLFNCTAGLAFAYHAVLTVVALKHAQSDLEVYGATFSLSLILAANAATILCTILLSTRQWLYAWHCFTSLTIAQWQWLARLTEKLLH